MIPTDFITAWRKHAPWPEDHQVEQDLVISRALVDLFAREEIARAVAFRGGTALHKLHLLPASRYSEDIDLVQVTEQRIGETLDAIRAALDPWLGRPRIVVKERGTTVVYRFSSEDPTPVPLRLKIEINTREHGRRGLLTRGFSVDSPWFQGAADLVTYGLPELIGTKLRALYQRKKGRDLFDVARALRTTGFRPAEAVGAFAACMSAEGRVVSRADYEKNLAGKMADASFTADVGSVLRVGTEWDPIRDGRDVASAILALLPGPGWTPRGDT